VTITEQRVPAVGGLQTQTATTVQLSADGTFTADVHPVIHTLYRASTGQTNSNAVSVQVRPKAILTRIGVHRFLARVVAARSFVGKYGILQRWRGHHWTSVRRVFFTRELTITSPTVVSRATFRARFGRAKIRILIPRSQAGPGYLMAASNLAR